MTTIPFKLRLFEIELHHATTYHQVITPRFLYCSNSHYCLFSIMVPSPRKQSQINPQQLPLSDECTTNATAKTYTEHKDKPIQKKARRVKLFLKHSVKNIASPSSVDFTDHILDNDDNNNNNNGNDKSARRGKSLFRHDFDKEQQQEQQQRPLSPLPPPSSSSSSSMTSTTHTIDQAMFSLHSYVVLSTPGRSKRGRQRFDDNSATITATATPSSSYVPHNNYDWLLDHGASVVDDDEEEEEDDLFANHYDSNETDDDQILIDENDRTTFSMKNSNYHLNKPWDIESFLEEYLNERGIRIQQEQAQEERAFSFQANFDDNSIADEQQDAKGTNGTVNDDDQSVSLETVEHPIEEIDNGDDDDIDDDFGEFQAATPLNQTTSSAQENDYNNMFETPLPPGQSSSVAATTQQDLPKIEVSNDEQQQLKEPELHVSESKSTFWQQQQQQQQSPPKKGSSEIKSTANKQCDHSPSDASSKSQEEAMVEEAVTILKSLPSNDFNEEFNSTPRNEILVETWNLATELENQSESPVVKTPARDSLTHSAQQPDRVKKENNDSQPMNRVTPTAALHSTDNRTEEEEEASSDASYTEISEIDSSESVSSHKTNNSSSNDNNETKVAPAQGHIVFAASKGMMTNITTPFSTPVKEEKKSVGLLDDELHTHERESGSALPIESHDDPIRKNSKTNTDDDYDSDDSFGDFCDAQTASSCVATTEQEIAACHLCEPSARQKESSSPSEPTGNAANRIAAEYLARIKSTSRPLVVALPPLRIETDSKEREQMAVKPPDPSMPEIQPTAESSQQLPLSPFILEANVMSLRESVAAGEEFDNSLCTDEEGSSSSGELPENEIPLFLRLPITDLSTAEARFARRQQQKQRGELCLNEKDRQKKLSTSSLFSVSERVDVDDENENGDPLSTLAELDLPQYYYTQENVDDTARVVENAPWHHISELWEPEAIDGSMYVASSYSFEESQDRRAMWENYITEELCKLDTAQVQVGKVLLRSIRPHKAQLEMANKSIHEFANNLQLAQMYMQRSQAAVRQAGCGTFDNTQGTHTEGCGWFVTNDFLHAWDKQEIYRALDTTLERIQMLLKTEKEVAGRISQFTFDASKPLAYTDITGAISQLLRDVRMDDLLLKIEALDDFRGRLARNEMLQSFHNRLHVLGESVAVRACRRRHSGLSVEYRSLLEAANETYRLLSASKQTHLDQSEALSPPSLSVSWSQAIFRALSYEADRALAAALLDPLIEPNSGDAATEAMDSEFDRELSLLAYEIQQDWGDSAKLRTVTHNLVIIRFDWESSNRYFLPVFHRTCRLLADVLHAYLLFETLHDRLVKVNLPERTENDDGGKEEKKSDDCQAKSHLETERKGRFKDDQFGALQSIQSEWARSKKALWDRCEAALLRCLDEYMNFAPHDNVFTKPTAPVAASKKISDSRWRIELEDLHNVLTLSEEFASLKSRFLGTTAFKDCKGTEDAAIIINRDFEEKLCDVFRKHLRHVHVEAMKSLGASLSQDNWELVALENLSKLQMSNGNFAVGDLLVEALSIASDTIDKGVGATKEKRVLKTLFKSAASETNELLKVHPVSDEAVASPVTREKEPERNSEVYNLISSVLADRDDANAHTRFVSKSACAVLFPWISRLLLVLERLPVIVEDITVVFANLCDLYFTTVFRICCGTGPTERVLLGSDPPTKVTQRVESFLPLSPSKKSERSSELAPVFGFRRRSSNSSMSGRNKPQSFIKNDSLPRNLQADICAPLWGEKSELAFTRKFIERAQGTLKDIVLIDKVNHWIDDPLDRSPDLDDDDEIVVKAIRNLEKRVGAAWGCLGVAAILEAACRVAGNQLMRSDLGQRSVKDLATIDHYAQAVFQIIPTLIRLSSRIASVRAILARRLVAEVC